MLERVDRNGLAEESSAVRDLSTGPKPSQSAPFNSILNKNRNSLANLFVSTQAKDGHVGQSNYSAI